MTSHLPVWGFVVMLALGVGTAGAETPPLKPQPRPAEAADAEGTAAAAQPSASPSPAGKTDGAPATPKPRPEGSSEDAGPAPPVPDIRPQGEADRADEKETDDGSASPATEDAPEPENEDGPAVPSPGDAQADQAPKDTGASEAETGTEGQGETPQDAKAGEKPGETGDAPADEDAAKAAPSIPEARPEDAPEPVEPLIAQPPSQVPAKNPSEGPAERPAAPEGEADEDASEGATKASEEDEAAKAAAAEDFRQCVWRLRALGVEFREEPAIADGGACDIAHPIEVEELAPGVAISPPVTLNCAVTEALAIWLKEVVKPAADELLDGAELRGVTQASGYVCRTRYNRPGAKISEHALANAIDVSAITFKSRSPITVKERDDAEAAASRFQKRIREGACEHFTTVLGPGANAAHATHFHFDLKERSNGYRICQ